MEFPIVGLFADGGIRNTWSLTEAGGARIALDPRGRSIITKHGKDPAYLINAAEAADFSRLADGRGVPTDGVSGFSLGVHLRVQGELRAEIHVLEYGQKRERLGAKVGGINAGLLYVPADDVRYIVISVRFAGMGSATIEEIEARTVRGKRSVAPGLYGDGDHEVQAVGLSSAARDLRRNIARLTDVSQDVVRQLDRLTPAGDVQLASNAQSAVESRHLDAANSFNRELLLEIARGLPQSNGSQYHREPFPYRVAIITDEYMYDFYRDCFADLVYVNPRNVDSVIERGFDLLLYVTCWKGLADDEWRGVKFREGPAQALEQIIAHAKAAGVPSVFQSIEDPSNFEYFLPIAEKFDHVFTSDIDMIPEYQSALRHDRVYYGSYGVNARLNNPIGSARFNLNRAFFAGSYPERYPERCADMETVFDSILNAGPYLTIADRNAGEDQLAFPAKYRPHCLDPIPHALLQQVHKLFRYNLNFNSIKTSPTMCAMRVYELQANGKGMISNYAESVFNSFPQIRLVATHENLEDYFVGPVSLEEKILNESLVRNVLTDKTAFDVAGFMLDAIGLDPGIDLAPPVVAVLFDESQRTAVDSIRRQSYPRIVEVGFNAAYSGDPGYLERLLNAEKYDYLAYFAPNVQYGVHYIQDAVNAFKYTDVVAVTSVDGVTPKPSVPHEYYRGSADPSRSVVVASDQTLRPFIENLNHRMDVELGYALPDYERCTAPEYGERGRYDDASDGARPILSVIVPVYNNGRFLVTKCFPSITRNRRWREFEIVLVDDGSSDGVTLDMCRQLAQEHGNVVFYSFDDGGSGSASRPRNKGIELAKADLISFLDPDNEISDRGYDNLLDVYREAKESNANVRFASGYQIKVSKRLIVTGKHSAERLSVVNDFRSHFFDRGQFPVISTQAGVMERSLFEGSGLRFVERAAGQDTLFGWELLLTSEAGAFTEAAHLIYYADRSDSITNAVGVGYFRKKLVMERAQVRALAQAGLLELYIERHLANFVKNWYLVKLEYVPEIERPECERILADIVRLYGADLSEFV